MATGGGGTGGGGRTGPGFWTWLGDLAFGGPRRRLAGLVLILALLLGNAGFGALYARQRGRTADAWARAQWQHEQVVAMRDQARRNASQRDDALAKLAEANTRLANAGGSSPVPVQQAGGSPSGGGQQAANPAGDQSGDQAGDQSGAVQAPAPAGASSDDDAIRAQWDGTVNVQFYAQPTLAEGQMSDRIAESAAGQVGPIVGLDQDGGSALSLNLRYIWNVRAIGPRVVSATYRVGMIAGQAQANCDPSQEAACLRSFADAVAADMRDKVVRLTGSDRIRNQPGTRKAPPSVRIAHVMVGGTAQAAPAKTRRR